MNPKTQKRIISSQINKKDKLQKIINHAIMIEVQRTNEKGEKIVAYTHQNYLSSHFKSEIDRVTKKYSTISYFIMFGTIIATYRALAKIPFLNNLVSTKISFKGKYLAVSTGASLIASFLASIVMANSILNYKQYLLKNQAFPAWFQKDRVINPERVFFELDDNHNNEPNIWHSGINESAIKKIIPDLVIGTPHKPHYPVAEQHHH